MTRLRTFAYALAVSLAAFSFVSPSSLPAAETTVTLAGRVDLAGLDVAPGQFTVRALQPQKRSVELGKAATNAAGDFQLSVDGEALALYGVILEASSGANRALVLESAILRARDAASPVTINFSSTVESAVLNWKIAAHGADLDAIRPGLLATWLRPLTDQKTRNGLKRAENMLAKWALAATPQSKTHSAVLRAAVGDIRLMTKRLTDLGVAAAAISELEQTARKDAEVAYILMMPYFLDL
jgi:hypothetical protein